MYDVMNKNNFIGSSGEELEDYILSESYDLLRESNGSDTEGFIDKIRKWFRKIWRKIKLFVLKIIRSITGNKKKWDKEIFKTKLEELVDEKGLNIKLDDIKDLLPDDFMVTTRYRYEPIFLDGLGIEGTIDWYLDRKDTDVPNIYTILTKINNKLSDIGEIFSSEIDMLNTAYDEVVGEEDHVNRSSVAMKYGNIPELRDYYEKNNPNKELCDLIDKFRYSGIQRYHLKLTKDNLLKLIGAKMTCIELVENVLEKVQSNKLDKILNAELDKIRGTSSINKISAIRRILDSLNNEFMKLITTLNYFNNGCNQFIFNMTSEITATIIATMRKPE